MTSSFLNSHYYDNLDPDFYMYITPELYFSSNIDTVEKAYEHYLIGTPPIPDRTTLLESFNFDVYYYFYSSNILEDNYIADDVRATLMDDLERLSIVHYARVGSTSPLFTNTNVDSNFNPYLYRVMHNVTSDLPDEQLYYEYLEKKNTENIVVGNIEELSYHVAGNVTVALDNLVVDDTLTIKENLIVQKDAYILGNLGADSTGLMVDGGSIVVDNKFGSMEQLFAFNRLSSNSLALGDLLIENVTDDTMGNVINLKGGNVTIENSLLVKEFALIGNGLVLDSDFSLQTDKNVKVNGIVVNSDERMKTNIESVSTSECLEKIKNIKIKSYKLKDSKQLDKNVVGVLAQDVKEMFPEIVSEGVSFLPSIMKATFATSTNRLGNILEETDNISINDTLLLIENKNKHYVKVIDISNTNIDVSPSVLVNGLEYTIYGKELKDALSVDYTQLFCHLIGAFQEFIK
uniref:Peptidase S74 domain-containing protein n=1 Tax=Pyramimonas orientalis virus TaxID=455367 RepID=A0A7M3UNV6_POV01|nr:hypothetical protein HWQ62_00258 [Pyramimonas orientalis virus]